MKILRICPDVVLDKIALLCILSSAIAGSGCGSSNTNASIDSKVNLLKEVESKDLEPLPDEHVVTDRIEIKTTMGTIQLGLFGKDAPKTVTNFLKYVDQGYYVNKIFHRIIPEFMIQGGGFNSELVFEKTDVPVNLEIIPGLKHKPGIVSMARTTNDPNSATSQFFICVGEAPQLNGVYAAFGKVELGMDVIEAISKVATKSKTTEFGTMADVPLTPVVIEHVKRL